MKTARPFWKAFEVLWIAAMLALAVRLFWPAWVGWGGCALILAAIAAGVVLYFFLFHPNVFIRLAGRFYVRIFYRMKITGRENVPASGGVILVCNHVSFVDWLIVVGSMRRPVRFVIDHIFYKGRIMKWILDSVRAIPIATPREDAGKLTKAYDRILEELAAGEIVLVFPEGRITYDGKLGPFKPGVMKILKRNAVPVVPMALSGLWGSFFSRHGGPAMQKLPRRFRASVELRIGKPLAPESVTIAGLQERVAALRGPREH